MAALLEILRRYYVFTGPPPPLIFSQFITANLLSLREQLQPSYNIISFVRPAKGEWVESSQ